jgi:hypothetical protein
MSRIWSLAAAGGLAVLAIAAAAPAQAASVVFTGARENVNPLTPLGVGRCGPGRRTVTIAPGAISSTGTSNLGDFTSTQSHCITPPLPTSIDEGEFSYDFAAGDSFFGTYTGFVALTATPGLFDATENLVITGGTGRFLGATGAVTTHGTLQFVNGNGVYSGDISGRLDAPGIPEPASWALMILGFGATGAGLRRSRRQVFA